MCWFFHCSPNSPSVNSKQPHVYEILIPEKLSENEDFNPCHQNFAICKELCHILTDEGKYISDDPVPGLERALEIQEEVRNPRYVAFLIADELLSEDFCFLLAMELLIPIGIREDLLLKYSQEREANKVLDDRALRNEALPLLIPRKILKFFILSEYYGIFLINGGDKLPQGSIPPSLMG